MIENEHEHQVDADYQAPYEVSCETCTAQCCRAPILMQLSSSEYQLHRNSIGIKVVIKPRGYAQRFEKPQSWVTEAGERRYFEVRSGLSAGQGIYKVESDCGNLQADNSCGIYNARPSACRAFETGSPECLKLRRAAGLDHDQPELAEYLGGRDSGGPDLGVTRGPVAETSNSGAGPAVPVGLHAAREVLAFESEWILSTLHSMQPQSWKLPTACKGWNVHDVVAHLVTGQRLVADVLHSVHSDATVISRPDFVGDVQETLVAFVDAVRDTAVAVAAANGSPESLVTIDGTTITLGAFTQLMVAEISMHAVDIAEALGIAHSMPLDGILACAVALPGLVDQHDSVRPDAAYSLRCPEFVLEFSWQGGAWFAEEGNDPCVIEGDAQQLIRFAYGRLHLDASELTTNRRTFAQAFKRYLSGP